MLLDLSCNACDRSEGDGDGNEGQFYRIEAFMHVIDVMVMEVMNIVIGRRYNANDRRDGDGDGSDGHFYRIAAVLHVIDVVAMVMEIVIGLKL